jgi:glycosyltransferase involved in cell wall biosynthesis
VIGPVLPWRGGIAQHTTMLLRALRDAGAAVQALSYSRQYPRWLYPGKSDRDPGYADHREPGVDYCIDSLNPITWQRAVSKIALGEAELVIVPWWTVFWAPATLFVTRALRRRGVTVVLLCHNVVEHETARWRRALAAAVYRQAQRFLVHTRQDAENLIAEMPGARVTVHPHPIYGHFPPATGSLPRRAACELLFYGFVRPYKGLDVLLEAMALLPQEGLHLTVAGEFWGGVEETHDRIRSLGIEDRVEVSARYHGEQETAELFARADLVVLPYRSATGSGVVPIAYRYRKPVVASRVGGLQDVVENGVTGLLVEAGSPEALADGIRRAMAFRPDVQAFERVEKRMSWRSLARAALTGDASPRTAP